MPAKAKMIDFHLTPDLVRRHKDQAFNNLFPSLSLLRSWWLVSRWSEPLLMLGRQNYGSSETSCTTLEKLRKDDFDDLIKAGTDSFN